MPAFTFAIPVKPRAVSVDWAGVMSNLQATLASILASENPAFRVVLAAHDELDIQRDDRITALKVPFPHVPEPEKGFSDKQSKLRFIGAHLRDEGYRGYVMFLDADDLISRRLVGYVLDDDNRRGYLLRQGYRFDALSGNLGHQPTAFDKSCGSCFVGWFENDELPADFRDRNAYFSGFLRHTECFEVASAHGREPVDVPFPAAVYVTNHADSLRMLKIGGRVRPVAEKNSVREGLDVLASEFAFDPASEAHPAFHEGEAAVSPPDLTRLAEEIEALAKSGDRAEAIRRAREADEAYPDFQSFRGGPRFAAIYIDQLFKAERDDEIGAFLNSRLGLIGRDFLWLDRLFRSRHGPGLAFRRRVRERALALDPDDTTVIGRVLTAARIARDFEHVLPLADHLKQILTARAAHPREKDGELWCEAGDLSLMADDPDEALRCYTRGLDLPAGRLRAQAGLASLALDRGAPDEAATLGEQMAAQIADPLASGFVRAATRLWTGVEPADGRASPSLEVVLFTHAATKQQRMPELGPPGVGLIEACVTSLREHVLAGMDVPITVFYDHRDDALANAYRANLEAFCASHGLGLDVAQGNGLRRQWLNAFAHRKADILLLVEHDHLFLPRSPHATTITPIFERRADISYIRLNRRRNSARGTDRVLVQLERDRADNLSRTARFSNTPHFHRGAFFDEVVLPLIKDEDRHDHWNAGASGVEENVNRFLDKWEPSLGVPFVLRALSSAIWGPPGEYQACQHIGV